MSEQRVLITGGSQGIGAALVGRMRDAGRDMAALCEGRENVTWVHLEGGDHGWHNKEDDLFRVVPEWLGVKTAVTA